LAGYVGTGVERERGQTIQFGVAGDGNVTGQGMEFIEEMLAPVAAEAASRRGDERCAIGKCRNSHFFGVDRDRQLQIGRCRRWRRAWRAGDVQAGHAEFSDLQYAMQEAGWCPIQMNFSGVDLQVGCLPAELADVEIAEQPPTGAGDVQLPGGTAFSQLDGGLQAAFAGRQPADATDATDDGGAGEEG
jgi:hypothetical protein